MTQDDALFRFRARVFGLAAEMGNVRAACRAMGIHPSTYYRWKGQVERFGMEILNPRERRRPRMPNATSPMIEQRVIAFALAFPTVGLAGPVELSPIYQSEGEPDEQAPIRLDSDDARLAGGSPGGAYGFLPEPV